MDNNPSVTRTESVDLSQKPICFSAEMLEEFLFCLAKTNQDLVKSFDRFSVIKSSKKPFTLNNRYHFLLLLLLY